MIQRIQTLYLLLIFVLAILFLSGEIVTFKNNDYFTVSGIHFNGSETVEQYWPFTVLMLIVPVFSLAIVFFYGKRKMQMRLTLLLIFSIILMTLAVIYYVYKVINSGTAPEFHLKLLFPILMFAFSILAYRGIRSDEAIVRSYDRLR